jgi:hypothetical protein
MGEHRPWGELDGGGMVAGSGIGAVAKPRPGGRKPRCMELLLVKDDWMVYPHADMRKSISPRFVRHRWGHRRMGPSGRINHGVRRMGMRGAERWILD